MFSELVESVARRGNKRKSWAVVLSGILQGFALVVLILIPLIYTQALPNAMLRTALLAPTAPAHVEQPATPVRPASGQRAVRLLRGNVVTEPPRIPQRIGRFEEAPLPPEAPIGEGPIGEGAGVDLFNVAPSVRNPVSPLPAAPSAPTRVPVTSTMEEAKLIARVQPVYPALAIQARIQGNVVLHAIIGKDGGVRELEVVSGHPLLARAALEAVRQWRYSPTLLSGQPVEVETTITVSFVLGQ